MDYPRGEEEGGVRDDPGETSREDGSEWDPERHVYRLFVTPSRLSHDLTFGFLTQI